MQPDLSGDSSSAPVVAGSTVYATTSLAFSGLLAALDTATGSLIWKVQTHSTLGDTGLSLWRNTIYMLSDDNVVVAFNTHDGSKRWQSPIKISVSGLANRLPLANDTGVYIGGGDGVLSALSPVDGSLLWTFQTGGDLGNGLALGPGVVYAGSADQHLYALNAADGSRLWRYTADNQLGAPTVAGNLLYLGVDDKLTAIDARTGAQLWQTQTSGTGDYIGGPVTVAGDIVYAPADAYLYAFSAQTHAVMWRFQSQPFDSNQNAPVVAGSTAYWSAANRTLYALDATATA
jgi:outer membrane protein assembly factor BamB